jgi:hypothetical protein
MKLLSGIESNWRNIRPATGNVPTTVYIRLHGVLGSHRNPLIKIDSYIPFRIHKDFLFPASMLISYFKKLKILYITKEQFWGEIEHPKMERIEYIPMAQPRVRVYRGPSRNASETAVRSQSGNLPYCLIYLFGISSFLASICPVFLEIDVSHALIILFFTWISFFATAFQHWIFLFICDPSPRRLSGGEFPRRNTPGVVKRHLANALFVSSLVSSSCVSFLSLGILADFPEKVLQVNGVFELIVFFALYSMIHVVYVIFLRCPKVYGCRRITALITTMIETALIIRINWVFTKHYFAVDTSWRIYNMVISTLVAATGTRTLYSMENNREKCTAFALALMVVLSSCLHQLVILLCDKTTLTTYGGGAFSGRLSNGIVGHLLGLASNISNETANYF